MVHQQVGNIPMAKYLVARGAALGKKEACACAVPRSNETPCHCLLSRYSHVGFPASVSGQTRRCTPRLTSTSPEADGSPRLPHTGRTIPTSPLPPLPRLAAVSSYGAMAVRARLAFHQSQCRRGHPVMTALTFHDLHTQGAPWYGGSGNAADRRGCARPCGRGLPRPHH